MMRMKTHLEKRSRRLFPIECVPIYQVRGMKVDENVHGVV
jgi:hypothetical protein